MCPVYGGHTNWNKNKVRVVVDLIAGMTEPQALALYHRFTGMRLANPLPVGVI